MDSRQKPGNFSKPPFDFVSDYLHNSLTTALISFDHRGTITNANPFASQQFFTETLVGANIRDFLSPEQHDLFQSGAPVKISPLVLSFKRKNDTPLLLFSHIYQGTEEFLVIGEQARLGDDQILRKMSVLNNELATLSRESQRTIRHEKRAKDNLQEQTDQLSTELLARNKELSESEARYKSLFENNHTTMLIIDPQSACIVDANPAACRFYGYDRDTLKRMKITEINLLSEAQVLKEMAAARCEHRSYFRFRHRLASGDIRDVDVYSGPMAILGQQCLYSIVHDVTDRHHLESKLRESSKKFRLLADHTYDWEYWINPAGNYEYISPSCERITGYTAEEFQSEPQLLYRIVNPEYAEQIRAHYEQKSTNHAGVCNLIFPITTKGGQECWLEHQCFPLFDERENYIGRRGNNRDITKRVMAELQSSELEKQVQQKHKMEAVGVMAGGMAHNFNNNLAIILGNLELSRIELSKMKLLSSGINSYLDNAHIAGLRARDLIKQIMIYSRKGSHEKKPLFLPLIFNETVTLLASTIPSSINLQQYLSPDCDQIPVLANESQIQEILLNLCNNAVHAMQERGNLSLSLKCVDLKHDDIPPQYSCQPGYYFCISVQDNGSGITPETMEKIFDPFFTTKDINEGTGMGLSTVQAIIEQHQGMITVESVVGEGTTFHLYFPGIDQPHATEPILQTGISLRGEGEKILYVEDDKMLASVTEQLLINTGYQVSLMTDSLEALNMFTVNAEHFDLIITDQTMPKLTGTELIRKIKQIRPEIPTILCTGNSNQIEGKSARESGISAFMLKPVDSKHLFQTIRQILDESKGESLPLITRS